LKIFDSIAEAALLAKAAEEAKLAKKKWKIKFITFIYIFQISLKIWIKIF
jgi:hypothetical protein